MQPFDALTMRAVLQEARPLLLNRKVEKIYQLGRDEVIIALRSKAGTGYFLLSAQASFGRLCFVNMPVLPKATNPPNFCQLLRKHLSGATLVAVDQLPGERVADLTFACVDELGTRSTKVLTAEVMGRHSNLIFWDKDSEKILGASHVVTQEMSRQREVAAGLKYARPPHQERISIFELKEGDFKERFQQLKENPPAQSEEAPLQTTFEQWLLTTFAGLGRHLAEEIVLASGITSEISPSTLIDETAEKLWQRLAKLQEVTVYKASMKLDLTRYSVLSWWEENGDSTESDQWKKFPAVNDMVEAYFRTLQAREQMQQLKDRIRSELRSETEKLEGRLANARKQLESTKELDQLKLNGDLILANINSINPGQTELSCENLYGNGDDSHSSQVSITLNPNLSPSQNAQHYYRQFAKARVRSKTATAAQTDAGNRLDQIKNQMAQLEAAKAPEELDRLKEMVLDRGRRQQQERRDHGRPQGGGPGRQQGQGPSNKQPRLLSIKSSDGHIIYVGRNRQENDILIVKLAQGHDIWMHVQGQEGAHVLIKLPNKQDPPLSTLKEAAQVAVRFSRVSLGSKVHVVYTHCKYVRKIAKDKPGLVRYENEKILEVDTAAPMPHSLRKLFHR